MNKIEAKPKKVLTSEPIPIIVWCIGYFSLLFASIFFSTFFGFPNRIPNFIESSIISILLIMCLYLMIYSVTRIFYGKGLNFFKHKYFKTERILFIISLPLSLVISLENSHSLFPLSIHYTFYWIFGTYSIFYVLSGLRTEKMWKRFHPDNYGPDSIRWIWKK